MSQGFDREKVLSYLYSRNWPELIRLLREESLYQELRRDSIAFPLLNNHLAPELLRDMAGADAARAVQYLEQVFTIHADQALSFVLEEGQLQQVLRGLAIYYSDRGDIATAYAYARQCAGDERCQAIIRQVERPREKTPPPPAEPAPSKPPPAKAPPPPPKEKEEPPAAAESPPQSVVTGEASRSLFSGEEDYLFFSAVGTVFSRYLTLPRVALSAVIDFEVVKGALTREEQELFFRALIDCVVLEENSYTPVQFLELDRSADHPAARRPVDQLKEKVIALADHDLLRIRNWSGVSTKQEMVRLIREQISNA